MRMLTSERGKVVHTEMTDDEALGTLRMLVDAGAIKGQSATFAASLVRRPRPTPNQMVWVHALVIEHGGKGKSEATPNPPAPNKAVYPRIVEWFLGVAGVARLVGSQAQEIKLTVRLFTPDGTRPVVLKFREKSPYIYITGNFPDPDAWQRKPPTLGFINTRDNARTTLYDSTYVQRLQYPDGAVGGTLDRLESDPVAVIREAGCISGACSFCGRTLTDARSKEIGYGPECAKHYGLPWGTDEIVAGIRGQGLS